MHILLMACSFVALLGCLWTFTRAQRVADDAAESERQAQRTALKLTEDRTRLTAAEREIETLRRELRKLSGKFYAAMREAEEEAAELEDQREAAPPYVIGARDATGGLFAPVCENYQQAQVEGPQSAAARCECRYCLEMRQRRAAVRSALVPKTVQGQAALAKLNAGKPQ